MADKRVFNLVHQQARMNAAKAIAEAPEGWRVTLAPPAKRRVQEEKYHAMIDDIAKQTMYAGRRWNALHMKRILIDEFADEMRQQGTPLHHDSMLIPSENGRRVIQLEIHSSEFYVAEAAAFIEFLYAWGAGRDVRWSDEAKREGVPA